ncbi:MAG: YraN family protein [Candidatus Hydrogenedentes bacterium]|nr:YraN family protein [Candidatus Hydrogenedentota bacterium]
MIFPWRFWRRRAPKPLGQRGEDLAAKHLRRAGYRILERNAKLGKFEIDIIAREGDTIAFVEVKTRRSNSFLEPEANVTPTKQQHIRRAAAIYISRHNDPETYYRYDIVSVVLPDDGNPHVTILRDAFRPE